MMRRAKRQNKWRNEFESTFVCEDCTHVDIYEIHRVRLGANKERCVKCGSTFLTPNAPAPKKFERRTTVVNGKRLDEEEA